VLQLPLVERRNARGRMSRAVQGALSSEKEYEERGA
jgi:hypothetical protein